MILELEIARICSWIEKRIMPPEPAARCLTQLLSGFLNAKRREGNLVVFEQYAVTVFNRHYGQPSVDLLQTLITDKAALLFRPPAVSAAVLPFGKEAIPAH